jgi:MFS family permease
MMLPSVQGILTQGRSPSQLGRIQGIYATANTAATALFASISGWLFQVSHALPYSLASGLGFGLLVATGVAWRRTPGKVADQTT